MAPDAKQYIEDILSQFTTQKDKLFYEKFSDDKFKECHPEAILFFDAYKHVKENCLNPDPAFSENVSSADAREMMLKYLVKRLSALTLGLDVDFLISLSGEVQEQRSAKGNMLCLLPSEDCTHRYTIRFKEEDRKELCHNKVHAVRKQLDLAKDGGLAVYRDDKKDAILTIGVLDKKAACRFPRFVMKNRLEWEFHLPSTANVPSCRLRYKQGTFMLPLLDMSSENRDAIFNKLKKLSYPKADKVADTIKALLSAIQDCDHGAIIVLLDGESVANETERLTMLGRGLRLPRRRSLINKKKEANKSLIKQMASIDGAILVDLSGNCYAYGVILDGIAGKLNNEGPCSSGSKDRGARFNSTKTYVEFISKQIGKKEDSICIGIVRSEDGMVDIFTEEIGRSE